jgi:hypothetical protein
MRAQKRTGGGCAPPPVWNAEAFSSAKVEALTDSILGIESSFGQGRPRVSAALLSNAV